MWDRVIRIEVEDKIELDYFLIVVLIKAGEKDGGSRVEKVQKRWKWTIEGKKEFKDKMERVGGERN